MRLRIGIVGCGAITALAHVPALVRREADGVDVVGLCDPQLARCVTINERFDLRARCYTDSYDMLMQQDVDAIVIATWPSSHAAVAQQLIEAGKHVLIQKPLALEEPGGRAIQDATYKTSANVMALPIVSSLLVLQRLKRALSDGALGEVRFCRIRTQIAGPQSSYADVRRFFGESVADPPPILESDYALGAGALADMGPYALAVFQYLFEDGLVLSAARDRATHENTAHLLLRTTERSLTPEVLASIEVGWQQQAAVEVCTVFGSVATATVTSDGRILVRPPTEGPGEAEIAVPRSVAVLPTSPVSGQDDWVNAILDGRLAAFRRSVDEAVWSCETIARAYRLSAMEV